MRLHGIAARTVTIGGTAGMHYANVTELENASGSGWATGTDRYGSAAVVLVPAKTDEEIAASR